MNKFCAAAEPHFIAYVCGDTKMIELYEKDVDLYIYCLNELFGEEVVKSWDAKTFKSWRTSAKTVLLGLNVN